MADEEKGEKRDGPGKESTQFKLGQKGGPGRPRGSKNKDTLRLDFWLTRLSEDMDLLEDHNRRIDYEFKLVELLLPKVPSISASPEEPEKSVLKILSEFDTTKSADAPKTSEPILVK